MDIEALRKRTKIPDLLTRAQIIPYIRWQTGVTVTACRVGRWINRGELLMMILPGRPRRQVTRKKYVDDLIRRYSS
jgi:hypothetical protein